MKVQKLILVSYCTEKRNERTENTTGPEPKPTNDTLQHAVKQLTLLCFLIYIKIYLNIAVRT